MNGEGKGKNSKPGGDPREETAIKHRNGNEPKNRKRRGEMERDMTNDWTRGRRTKGERIVECKEEGKQDRRR